MTVGLGENRSGDRREGRGRCSHPRPGWKEGAGRGKLISPWDCMWQAARHFQGQRFGPCLSPVPPGGPFTATEALTHL